MSAFSAALCVIAFIIFAIMIRQFVEGAHLKNDFDRKFERSFAKFSQLSLSPDRLEKGASPFPRLTATADGISLKQSTIQVRNWHRNFSTIDNNWLTLADCMRHKRCLIGRKFGLRACELAALHLHNFRKAELAASLISEGAGQYIQTSPFQNVELIVKACFGDEVIGEKLRARWKK